jgi:DeoR/GlpR family transcriptional regulator of sugar metabolism
MLREERLARITQQLLKDREVLCTRLADVFGLNVATVRLDLAELERRGLAKRVYGGAVLADPDQAQYLISAVEPQLAERFKLRGAEKEAIGRAAVALVSDGETIMIDGGTTTYQVCRNLAGKRDLTIVSCALHNLWQELVTRSNLHIFLTGGYLRAPSFSLVGEVAEATLRGFRATRAILGIDGISIEHGLTTHNFMEASVKKRMIEACQELIIVADHTKLGKVGLIPVAPIERMRVLVTDSGAPMDYVTNLRAHGVEVILAPVATPAPNQDISDARRA